MTWPESALRASPNARPGVNFTVPQTCTGVNYTDLASRPKAARPYRGAQAESLNPRSNLIHRAGPQPPGTICMSAYKSDFLKVLAERGFIHQVSEPDALDQAAASGQLTAYIRFDCTAASLHVG